MTIRVPAVFCCIIATVYAAIAPGENSYLPPKTGYNYPRPNVPFQPSIPPPRPPTPPRPTVPTRPPQATVPAPFAPSPSPYRPPSGPPSTPFRPTGPPSRPPTQPRRPTYVPPTQTPFRPQPTSPPFRPTGPPVRPPSGPGYLPPQPPSYRPPGPPATSPPYRPTQPRPTPPRPPATYGPPSGRPTSPFRPPGPPATYGPPTTQPRRPDQGFVGENDHLLVPHKPAEPFDFKYAVKDEFGNDYSHNAINDGDTTNGEYRVQLPDGRTQVVKYTANWASGFHAKISYEGQPKISGGFPSQRPTGPSYPSGPGPSRPSPPGQQYTPGGGYKY